MNQESHEKIETFIEIQRERGNAKNSKLLFLKSLVLPTLKRFSVFWVTASSKGKR